jgi:imidazolonepropionase-like amidohydrolase
MCRKTCWLTLFALWALFAFAVRPGSAGPAGGGADKVEKPVRRPLHELNDLPAPPAARVVAIVGATLIDGTGGPPVADSAVIVRGDKILRAGPRGATPVPGGAEVIEAGGLTLLPGLIDAHFHLDGRPDRPGVFLRHGVTALRDPGAWIEAYDAVRKKAAEKANDVTVPRLFLTGPHLDCPPAAHPKDAILTTTPDEVRAAVNRFADQGAVAIKVYYRLPADLIAVATEAAHARGIPVTAHLELVPAVDAIRAGLDGIEHATSFGTSLAEPEAARRFEAAVRGNNATRNDARYELWGSLDLDHCPRLKPVLELAVGRHVVLCPTLAVFELREGDPRAKPAKVRGYQNMLKFTALYHRAGGTIVVGSHSDVPHADYGWAYPREMELLVEAGLTPAEVIRAATLDNARYFRADDRLGSVEPGKRADLVLVEADPLKDISAMRRVRRVMLEGNWVDLSPPAAGPATRELLRPIPPATRRTGG